MMNRFRIVTIATIVLVFSWVLVLPSQVGAGVSAYSVAFIYASNISQAQDFQNFLISYGITVDLVANSSAGTQNYSTFNLIIIGNDTGTPPPPNEEWLPVNAVSAINGSGKPILGIGAGGSIFFDSLKLPIGWEEGWINPDNETSVVNDTSTIFTYPISITIPADGIIQLYDSNVWGMDIYVPNPIAGVTLLGQEVGVDSPHYPLIMNGSRYFLWGFSGSPSNMTQTGKNLFANVVSYLTGDTAVPEFSAVSILLLTFLITTVTVVAATKCPARALKPCAKKR